MKFKAITTIAAIMESSMSSTDKSVAIAFAMFANTAGHAWPTVAKVGARASVSERTVQRSIRALIGFGVLTPVEAKRRTLTYAVAGPNLEAPGATQCHPVTVSPLPRHSVTPGATQCHPPLGNPPMNPPMNPPLLSRLTPGVRSLLVSPVKRLI